MTSLPELDKQVFAEWQPSNVCFSWPNQKKSGRPIYIRASSSLYLYSLPLPAGYPLVLLPHSPAAYSRSPVYTPLYIYISPEITNYIYKAVLLECWTIYYGCRSKSQYLDILCNILPLYMIEFSARKLYLLITMKQTYNYQMQYSSTSVFVYITVLPLPPKGERC